MLAAMVTAMLAAAAMTMTVTAVATTMMTKTTTAAVTAMAKGTEYNQIKAATATETMRATETVMGDGNSDNGGGDMTTVAAVAAAVPAAAYCRGCLLDDVKSDTIFWLGGWGGLARSRLLSLLSHHSLLLEVSAGGEVSLKYL
jgi:hypothetical protein